MGAGQDLQGLHKDGATFPIEINLSLIKTAEGILITAAIRDITARKAAERELMRSNGDLEQFAHVASHDLQEPLRMVSSYAQLLAKRYKSRLDAEADEFIDFLVDGAKRMQRLIRDMLELSRVGRETREKNVNCEKILERALANLEAAIQENNATVTRDHLPVVIADPTQLLQLFQNLIANAIKFHGEQPPGIYVSAMKSDVEWIFSVRDNGIGIDPQFNQRIFVIFQRLHGNREYPGTGIGLAICKKIVDGLGGRIWVESAPGKGATFYFSVPIKKTSHDPARINIEADS